MSVQRRLAELVYDFEQAGLTTFSRGLRRSKPGRLDYVLALQDQSIEKYRAEGTLTYGMEWMAKNLESPQLALSPTQLKSGEFDQLVASSETFVEEKFDGCRCIVIYSPKDGWEFFSRNRSVTDYCFSHYSGQICGFEAESWKGFFKRPFVLDSELISINPSINGRIVTDTILAAVVSLLALEVEDSKKAQAEAGYPLRFKCFDILSFDDKNLFRVGNLKRKEVLHKVIDSIHAKGKEFGLSQLDWIEEVPYFQDLTPAQKQAKFDEIIARGGEGLILKGKSSTYEPVEARSKDRWVKWKKTVSNAIGSDIDAFVSGFEIGSDDTANENLVGSLDFSVYLVPSGEEHVIARCSNIPREMRQQMTVIGPDGKPTLDPSYYGKVAAIEGMDISSRAKRFQHARILRWRDGVDGKNQYSCTFSEAALADLVL